MGQLGFHVQPDGIVTLVESAGQAWQAGLRQNSRLVEICKVAVATLTYDQMVDLLKTSITVTLTVIPPLPDGSPRKGCTLQNCKYNEPHYEGDYENTNSDEAKGRRPPQGQPAVSGNHRKFYERSFSPPRSSNSSGYGTGSSSKSFRGQEAQLHTNVEGTLTSSSSGHSGDDKWYDRLQELDPPPVPVKGQHASRNVHANNTFPSTPKRNNSYHVSQIQSNHGHYGVGHGKIHVSNSLPLQHVNVSQPLVAAIHNNMNDLDLGYKLEKNNILKQHNERLRQDAEYTSPTRGYNTIAADLSRFNLGDGHSSDSSLGDRLNLVGSEDELITGSGAVNGSGSPRVARRPAKQLNATPQTPAYYGRTRAVRDR
ncbi:unnamed protein product [Callosobruchus maculatus]|uniref:PDZ domain-containing protein n=1 Tax=Callosobruchus maculatus TaxID=64391 RepID=A0A653CXT8_CALMS|nr:unnamed protein product [Callosobruchus maculatus]